MTMISGARDYIDPSVVPSPTFYEWVKLDESGMVATTSDLRTDSGEIKLAIPKNSDVNLAARTSSEDIDNQLGKSSAKEQDEAKSVAIRLNKGTLKMNVESHSGDITLKASTANQDRS